MSAGEALSISMAIGFAYTKTEIRVGAENGLRQELDHLPEEIFMPLRFHLGL